MRTLGHGDCQLHGMEQGGVRVEGDGKLVEERACTLAVEQVCTLEEQEHGKEQVHDEELEHDKEQGDGLDTLLFLHMLLLQYNRHGGRHGS